MERISGKPRSPVDEAMVWLRICSLVPTRFTGFDQKILALYARGMTVRDIQT